MDVQKQIRLRALSGELGHDMLEMVLRDDEERAAAGGRLLADGATFATAHKFLTSWADSYSRLPMLLHLRRYMSAPDWWRLLGVCWTTCDNIATHKERLRAYLLKANERNLRAMMRTHEARAVSYLPPVITVYRGCYAVNRSGLSWTLSRDVAAQFPSFMRYRRDGDAPLLLTGTVPRSRVVLKLDRKEREAVCAAVTVTREEPIG